VALIFSDEDEISQKMKAALDILEYEPQIKQLSSIEETLQNRKKKTR
jgi:hypothetical protein